MATAIIEHGFSAVLDVSVLRKGAQVRFMTAFAETLYRLNRRPLHLMVDEADAFAPQKPFKEQARLLGAFEDIVRRGRARGLGVTLITQRAAVINKDVLTQCEVLVALRTIAPQDRKAIDAWIEVHGTPQQRDELMASLPSLPIGTAWFWSPGWLDVFKRVKIRERETFDSSATPKVGQRKATPKVLASIDLAKLGDQIKASAERAKENDPKHLRAEISRLKKELENAARMTTPASAPAEIVEVPVFDKDALAKLDGIKGELGAWSRNMVEDLMKQLRATDRLIDEAISKTQRAKASLQAGGKGRVLPVSRGAQPKRDATSDSGVHGGSVSGGLRRMMVALAQRPDGLTKKQLGVRAGLSSSSGTFGTYLGRLRANGWVEGSEVLRLTDAGFKALDDYEALPTGDELLRYWLGELGGGAARMLQGLAEVYPRSLSDEQLGEVTGLSPGSGTFGTYLGKLRTLELIEGPRSALRASEELFV